MANTQQNGKRRPHNVSTHSQCIHVLTMFDTLHLSVIFEVASEICVLQDGAESTIALSGDPWDAVMCMTQHTTTGSKHKRMSLEPPPSDTPHIWDDYVKHAALANLLDGAVSHEDLHLRKTYIERIMKLPSDTQRALMGLIERRKKKSKTPRKSAIGGSSEGIDSTPNRSRQSPKAQNYPYINQRATPLQNQRPANGENHGLQSPFSPLVENLDKQQSASKRKSIISKGRSSLLIRHHEEPSIRISLAPALHWTIHLLNEDLRGLLTSLQLMHRYFHLDLVIPMNMSVK